MKNRTKLTTIVLAIALFLTQAYGTMQPTSFAEVGDCCSYTVTPEPTNKTTIGKEAIFWVSTLVNKSDCGSIKGNLSFHVGNPNADVTLMSPSDFELMPGSSKLLVFKLNPPISCTEGQMYTRSYTITSSNPATKDIKSKDCGTKKFSISLKCTNKETCCKYIIQRYMPPPPLKVEPNETFKAVLKYTNLCTNDQTIIVDTKQDKNIKSIDPNGPFTVGPKASKEVVLNCFVPKDSKNFAYYNVIFIQVSPAECSEKIRYSFKVPVSQVGEKCCDVATSFRTELPAGFALCPGESYQFRYTLSNNCFNPITVTPIKVSVNDPVVINPSTPFELAPASDSVNSKKDVFVTFTMPPCNPSGTALLRWSFTKDCGNTEAPKTFSIACKTDCPGEEETCCNWELPYIPWNTTMCAGETFIYNPKVINKCNTPLTFTITPDNSSTKVNDSTSAVTITVPAAVGSVYGAATFKVGFAMPQCEPGSKKYIEYTVKPDGCEPLVVKGEVLCKNCEECCDLSIYSTNDTPVFSLCKGEKLRYPVKIKNNCPKTVVVTPVVGGNDFAPIFDKTSLTIGPNGIGDLLVTLTMPPCQIDSVLELPFTLKTNCGKEYTTKVRVKCKNCETQPCCNWSIPPLAWNTSMCPGETFRYTPSIVSKCPTALSFTLTPGNSYTKINGSSSPVIVNVPASGQTTFTVDFAMPPCKPGDKFYIQYSVSTAGCPPVNAKGEVVCKKCEETPPPCCNIETALMTRMTDLFALCPGEKFAFQYRLTNKCPKAVKITLKKLNAADPISFDPAVQFTLNPAGQAGDNRTVGVMYTMPNCQPGGAVTMSFSFDNDCGTSQRPLSLTIRCKDCFCPMGKKVTIKGIKNYPAEGFFSGIVAKSTTSMTFYYNKGDTKFTSIKNSDNICYEVCYTESKSKDGRTSIYTATDIRQVTCPAMFGNTYLISLDKYSPDSFFAKIWMMVINIGALA